MTVYTAKLPNTSGIINFTAKENHVWKILIKRQLQTIKNRAAPEFITGLKKLNFPIDRIPQIKEINFCLTDTNWEMVPVTGTIPVTKFFKLLAERKFPAATFIRTMEDLDYLTQPDLFHEYFGHGPMLTNHAYADFLQWYGNFAKSLTKLQQNILSRLFWYTIEFGLVNTSQGLRIFGGGILSSHKETIYAIESDIPVRIPYELQEVMQTAYTYDAIQKKYFVLDDVKVLYDIQNTDNLLKLIGKIQTDLQKTFITC